MSADGLVIQVRAEVQLEPPEALPLAEWERDALRKLRLLRQARKPAILFVTENGTVQIFRAERAGLLAP